MPRTSASLPAIFTRTLASLLRGEALRYALMTVALTGVLFAAIWWLVAWTLANTSLFETGWLDTVADVLGTALALVASLALLPSVFPIIASFFHEPLAHRVESKYPPLSSHTAPWSDSVLREGRFALVSLVLNAVALPVSLAFPPVFYGLNGYLLGREFFELVAGRHHDRATVRALRQRHRVALFVSGMLFALLATIPVVNLLAPTVCVVWMVHLHRSICT